MNLPSVSIKDLLEAGVHLGHKTFRWNPKMKQYIYGEKNSVHIIDLSQTLELLNKALIEIHKSVSNGGKLLFVSTGKRCIINEIIYEQGCCYDIGLNNFLIIFGIPILIYLSKFNYLY